MISLLCPHQQKRRLMAEALKLLPERERDVLVLLCYQGMSLKDFAARFGISYSGYNLIKSRALGWLRTQFEK